MPIARLDILSSLYSPERRRGKKKKKNSRVSFFSELVETNYPVNMSICPLTVEEALGDQLRCKHFHCGLEGPNLHRWNRLVFYSHAAEALLMLSLETERHCIHEKYC